MHLLIPSRKHACTHPTFLAWLACSHQCEHKIAGKCVQRALEANFPLLTVLVIIQTASDLFFIFNECMQAHYQNRGSYFSVFACMRNPNAYACMHADTVRANENVWMMLMGKARPGIVWLQISIPAWIVVCRLHVCTRALTYITYGAIITTWNHEGNS